MKKPQLETENKLDDPVPCDGNWIKRYFSIFIFIEVILTVIPKSASSQNLNLNNAIEYLNDQFQKFPFQNNSSVFKYSISITNLGELKIEKRDYWKNTILHGETTYAGCTIYKIAINQIDLKESFQITRSNEINHIINIYPVSNGFFYEEKTDSKGNQIYKKTVPYNGKKDLLDGMHRNSIDIYTGNSIDNEKSKNLLSELCDLVLSDPLIPKLDTDDTQSINYNSKSKATISIGEPSNTIKINSTGGGLIEIPIVLNDVLRINFIFDSGASELSLSPDVALTLFRTGTVTENDWLASQTYLFADGTTARSKRFLIRKLIIGNQILTNIEASISNSIDAPMLVGQNVLQKLGSITIDYENGILIINPKH